MCLYPRRLKNRKYTATKKNQGNVPELPITGKSETGLPVYDERVQWIEAPCGQCIECRKAKARGWQVRLSEEIKVWSNMYFVTFTFSPEGLREILFKHGIAESNAAAAFALRHCMERFRKDYKRSLRHWMITELGHQGTERIHMHGLLFNDEPLEFEEIERKKDGIIAKWKYWKYGLIFVGDYVNQCSVNYMVKYMVKIDNDHPGFIGQVLCSPGIGRNYIDHLANTGDLSHKYRPRQTKDYYSLPNGVRVKLPSYYKQKFLDEDERELSWREFMDLKRQSVMGISIPNSAPELENVTEKAQEINKCLGYGDDSKEWQKRDYNITRKMLQNQERINQRISMLQALFNAGKADYYQVMELQNLIAKTNGYNTFQEYLEQFM